MPATPTLLTRTHTDRFFAQRTFTNESKSSGDASGDWFYSIWALGILTTSQYNSLVDDYNSNESDASGTVGLKGTAPDGTTFDIDDDVAHPRPIHK